MYLNEVSVGTTIDIPPVEIDREQMLDFARRYDPIPLHTDEEYAKSTRFGDLIAPGVMSFMAVWGKYVERDVFAEELIAGKSTKIEWFKPVYAGDTLKGTATVSQIIPRNKYNGIAVITIDIRNQAGELVISSETESIVKYRQEE